MSLSNVQLLLADVAFIIILARLLGTAAKLLGQPPVLGEILAGILLGPTFFHGTITKVLFPTSLISPLTALADIGLVLFMFVVGYEVDLRLIRGRERVAVGVSTGSVLLPLALGTALGVWLAHRSHLHHVSTFALFIGTAMAATAFPVLARILTDRGLHRTRIGGIALASAAIADVLAWILLAVVVALAGSSAQWKVLLAIPYAAAMFGIVRPLLRRLSRIYLQAGRLTPNILATVLAGLLLSCYATNWMGLHFIFGAFLFGVIMPRDNVLGLREEILERLEQVSVLVLLPIYFVVSGLSINLSTIGSSGPGGTRRDPGRRHRREAGRRLRRRPAHRGPRPQRWRDRHADEHPRPDRTGHPGRGAPAAHPDPAAVHPDGGHGPGHHRDERAAAQGHLPGPGHAARPGRRGPGAARGRPGVPDPGPHRPARTPRDRWSTSEPTWPPPGPAVSWPWPTWFRSEPTNGWRSARAWVASCCR